MIPFSLAIQSGTYGYKTTTGTFVAFREDSTGTYTFATGSTGSTVDLGARNTYRYINATNVYNKGKSDGGITATSGWEECYFQSQIGSGTMAIVWSRTGTGAGGDNWSTEYFQQSYYANYEGTTYLDLAHIKILKACKILHFGKSNDVKCELLTFSAPTTTFKAVQNPPGTTKGYGASGFQIFIVLSS